MPPLDRYAVIGNPVGHSKSPDIHALFAAQTGQKIAYQRLLAPLDGFVYTVNRFISEGAKGANITVPFKLEAFAMASVLTPRAQAAGAVNTLKFESGTIFGDNTDGAGLMADIIYNAKTKITGSRVLILGAGGAARGVLQPLLAQNPEKVIIANRSVNKAVELASQFSVNGNISASSFSAIEEPFDIVINATSTGLSNERPPVSSSVFCETTLALDMVYGDQPTLFLRFASEHGAKIRDGFGMLVEQAAESFFIWRGIRPDTKPVFAVLRP